LCRHLNIPVMSSMESHHQEVIGFLRQGWRSYSLTYFSFLVTSVVDPDSHLDPVVPYGNEMKRIISPKIRRNL
jgi:hypothetical protein